MPDTEHLPLCGRTTLVPDTVPQPCGRLGQLVGPQHSSERVAATGQAYPELEVVEEKEENQPSHTLCAGHEATTFVCPDKKEEELLPGNTPCAGHGEKTVWPESCTGHGEKTVWPEAKDWCGGLPRAARLSSLKFASRLKVWS